MTAITTPIAAQSIHEGKNEPITLICGPMASPLSIRSRTVTGAERQRRRGLQELDLCVQLHESGTTQLAAGGEEIGEGPESLTVRRHRRPPMRATTRCRSWAGSPRTIWSIGRPR